MYKMKDLKKLDKLLDEAAGWNPGYFDGAAEIDEKIMKELRQIIYDRRKSFQEDLNDKD